MKHMKKISALLIALLIALSMFTAAFAAEETEFGSITINGVGESSTYEIYQLLVLESYSTEGKGAYSYKVADAWASFFKEGTGALDYVNIDPESKYVTWNTADKGEDSDTAEFAKLALAFAKANNITPVKSTTKTGDMAISGSTGVFSDLSLGYYLVDSTVGALCGLTTTNPNASINAKNGIPTLEKAVLEDSTEQWGTHNTADIGQTVEYRITINVQRGAENYVIHDEMSDGLSFKGITKIEHNIPGSGTHEMAETVTEDEETFRNYTIKTAYDDDAYAEPCADCTFEIEFSEYLCNKLQANDKIVVYYEAMLNRNAVIAGDGNINEAYLTFGEGNETQPSATTTKTFGIDIVKTDSQNTLIDGAKFRIYDAETGGNEVEVVALTTDENGVVTVYRRARAEENEDEGTEEIGVEIVVTNGKVSVVGFDNGTYYLEETEAPNGYNKLTSRQKFIIADGNLEATFNGEIYSTGSGVHVVNKTGSMLPETGGIGTTIFYAAGGILVAAAIVLLITRKRVNDK